MRVVIAAGIALVITLGSDPAYAARTKTYAVVVANNLSFNGKQSALRFADDDGVRYAELFSLSAERTELFSVLDADTQRLYPEMVSRATPPRRADVLAGLSSVFEDIRRDVDAGYRVVFYFVFSGHGEVTADNEGFVHLLDGPLTRADLFEHVISASPATVNHLLIDACNAYFMVARRGGQSRPAGDFSGLIRRFLDRESLAAHPNTGVVLSTSSAAEVHEWGRIEAGVFSHVMRSALAGAADANRDGAVDYDEAAAYVAAASGSLPDRNARLEVFARAPAQDLTEPLARVPETGAHVRVPKAWIGHWYLEDDRGVRYADFNKTNELGLDIRLVPRPRYYLRDETDEIIISDAAADAEVAVTKQQATPITVAMRGSVNDAYASHLFEIPFGPQFVVGFKQASFNALTPLDVRETVSGSPLTPWKWVSATLAGGLGIMAGSLEVMARQSANDYRNGAGTSANLADQKGRAESLHRLALITGGVAVTAAATAVGLHWFEE